MSNAVMSFGVNDKDRFSLYDVANVFVCGGTGSGKSNCLEAMLRSILLSGDGGRFYYYTGKLITSLPLGYFTNSSYCAASVVGCTGIELEKHVLELAGIVASRKELLAYTCNAEMTKPPIYIFLDDVINGDVSDNTYTYIRYILEKGKSVGVYLFLSETMLSGKAKQLLKPEMFDFLFVTRLWEEASVELLGSDIASKMPKYGKAVVKAMSTGNTVTYDQPFYSMKVIKEIVAGDTVPRGCVLTRRQRDLLNLTVQKCE